MCYRIYGAHCDGAYSIKEGNERKKWEQKQDAIDAALALQAESDRNGYRETFTVFDREMEVYRTHSHPVTFYEVYYYHNATDPHGETIRTEDGKHFKHFTDLEDARNIARSYSRWQIYRTYDYWLVDSLGDTTTL